MTEKKKVKKTREGEAKVEDVMSTEKKEDVKPVGDVMKSTEKTVEVKPREKPGSNNAIAAIAYLVGFITGAIVYVTADKNDKYVRFHALQAIIFGVVLGLVLVVAVLIDIMSLIIFGAVTGPLACLCGLVFWGATAVIVLAPTIFLMYQAYTGVKFKIPVIGEMAEKYV